MRLKPTTRPRFLSIYPQVLINLQKLSKMKAWEMRYATSSAPGFSITLSGGPLKRNEPRKCSTPYISCRWCSLALDSRGQNHSHTIRSKTFSWIRKIKIVKLLWNARGGIGELARNEKNPLEEKPFLSKQRERGPSQKKKWMLFYLAAERDLNYIRNEKLVHLKEMELDSGIVWCVLQWYLKYK